MALAIAGRIRISWPLELPAALHSLRYSISGKLAALVIVFVAVPLVVYVAFRQADAEKRAVLMESIAEQGQIIAGLLRPDLQAAKPEAVLDVGRSLAGIMVPGLHVRVLLRPKETPGPPKFYYMAAEPAGKASELDADSRQLMAAGVFDKLSDSCEGGYLLGQRYTNSSGEREILSSLTPILSPAGCWVVITSNSPEEIGGLITDRPYWARPEVQFAALVYFLMAALVMWLLLGLRGQLDRFAEQARRIRRKRGGPRFADVNKVPELAGVAVTLDDMVGSLEQTAHAVREAAEETAHALKSPVAIVAQSIEPLRMRIHEDDADAQRAIRFIDRSVERLGDLVTAVRELGEATADLIDQERGQSDLSGLVAAMLADYEITAKHAGVALKSRIAPGVLVGGEDPAIESVIENILDNAFSFSERGGSIWVTLERGPRDCRLIVEDEGPGVRDGDLPHLFDRHFSSRPVSESGPAPGDSEDHFGIGLWIVRRNVEALKGRVHAENRAPTGLRVVVQLPLLAL
jgi:two-component system sensor histidine kinase ChvG